MLLNDQPSAIVPIGEKRVTLRNLDWQKYQQMRQLIGDRTRACLTDEHR